MSTTSKKPIQKHETWQDSIKSTDEIYRQYDNDRRKDSMEEEKKRKRLVNELILRKEEMEKELSKRDKRDETLIKKREKKEEEINRKKKEQETIENKISINKKKWYNKFISLLMGWES